MWLYFNPLADRPWLLRVKALPAADVAAHLYYYAAGDEQPTARFAGEQDDDGSLTWRFHGQPPYNAVVDGYGVVVDRNAPDDPGAFTLHLVARATHASGAGQPVTFRVTLEQDDAIIGGTAYVSTPGGAQPFGFEATYQVTVDAGPNGEALLEREAVFYFTGGQ